LIVNQAHLLDVLREHETFHNRVGPITRSPPQRPCDRFPAEHRTRSVRQPTSSDMID
jgi:hypothetical protein